MSTANCPASLVGDLPDDPGCALNYHYGMLLGAADLSTEQGFHVGQRRRHARTLHGRGVVQGLAVQLVPERQELRVEAGLALDARGRELVLAEAHCVSLAAWWLVARQRPEFAAQRDNNTVTLQLLLTLQHRVCADRPVPAIAPTCHGDDLDALQASRLCESARLELQDASRLPPPAPGVPAAALPLYALFGLLAALPAGDAAVDRAVADRAAVSAAAPAQRVEAALAALDRAVALSTARDEGGAPDSLAVLQDRLPLAWLHDLVLKRQADDSWVVDGGRVEWADRPALLSTGTLQRLLAALLAGTPPVAAAPAVPAAVPPAAPLPVPAAPPAAPLPPLIVSAASNAERLTLQLAEAVHVGSAQAPAVAVVEFDEAHGWRAFSVRHVDVEDSGRRLLLTLGHAPRERLLRVVLDLAGRKPLLAADHGELGGRYHDAFTLTL